MLTDYLQWQFVLAPAWLFRLFWNMERVTWRFFSVGFMFRTLLAYWHKDSATFTGGTITKFVTIFLWNIISRAIGFLIRTTVILTWLIVQIIYLPLAAIALLLFILWPILILLGLSASIAVLFA